ncbi:MAG: hypothetical protein Q9187_004961 [Circinaria calcarea]
MAPARDSSAEEGLLPKESWDSKNSLEPIIIQSSKRSSVMYTAICVLAGMAFSLIVLSVTSSIKIRQPLQPTRLSLHELGLDPALKPGEDPVENGYWCGTTPEEARTKGCQFDLVLYSWVPPPCYDAELQQAYKDERESEWYRHREGLNGEMVPQERAALGIEEGLWLSWAYHDYHCQFIWRMMTRILRNSSMGVPGRLLEYYHTDHCIHVLKGTEPGPAVDISTLVSLNYSTCYSRT